MHDDHVRDAAGTAPDPAARAAERAARRARNARLNALLALGATPYGSADPKPDARRERLAEAVLDFDDAIAAVRARCAKRGFTNRAGELSARATRLVSLVERRDALLRELSR